MNWQDLGGALIRAGAPILGNALGGPLGGMIGGAIGNVLGNALGVDPTPDAINNSLNTTPPDILAAKLSAAESEAQARWPALAEIAKADAAAASTALTSVGETMRAEATAADKLQRWWRPVYAFELTIECAAVWTIAIADILLGSGKISAFVIGASTLLSVYWGARFGVLGVYVGGRSYEKVAAGESADRSADRAADQLSPTLVNKIIKLVRAQRTL